ncbi:hypothetical protein BH09BAC5_BH09BAC5_29620 [soil metagenome]
MQASCHLSIPKPCHENWSAMTAQEQGRHCDVCCKVVVDFTKMPTEKVIDYIAERNSEKICGRFREDQLKSNATEKKSPRNKYRVFMAAIYFVFGGLLFSSCKSNVPATKVPNEKMGKVQMNNSFSNEKNFIPAVDTPFSRTRNKTVQSTSVNSISATPVSNADTAEPEIMKIGQVLYIPKDTTRR